MSTLDLRSTPYRKILLRYKILDIRLAVFIFYFSFCFFNIIEFKLWQQVTYLWSMDGEINSLWKNYHGMRYLLVYPLFLISNSLSISYDWLFSITVPFLILISTVHIVAAAEIINDGFSENIAKNMFLLAFLILAFISLFMNGRIMFSITASAILIYNFMNWRETRNIKNILFILFACFLSSVSSVTFSVATVSCIVFMVWKTFTADIKNNARAKLLIATFFVLTVVSPFLFLLTIKNIKHFGDGIEGFKGMLSHGTGKIFFMFESGFTGLIFMIIAVGFLYLSVLGYKYGRVRVPLFMIVLSLSGGLFGFSTMMMVIPPAMSLMYLAMRQPGFIFMNSPGSSIKDE